MRLLQWVYTSCYWNIDGSPGYHTFSHSENLTPDEVKELAHLFGRYDLPNDVSRQPDSETIAAQCPVLFYSVTLTTGRKVICRTSYLGRNFYDGRWGNFIAHALILDQGEWSDNVFDFIDSSLFWRDLPEDIKEKSLRIKRSREDIENPESRENPESKEKPDFLPSRSLDELSGNFSSEAFHSYMTNPDKKNQLSLLLGRVLYRNAEDSPLPFGTSPMEAAAATAALAYLLPLRLLNKLNIATYLQIAGKPVSFSKKYSILGTDSPIREDSASHPVSAIIDAHLQDRPGFLRFLDSFGDALPMDLETIAGIFLLQTPPNTKLGENEFVRLTDLVLKHRSSPGAAILGKQADVQADGLITLKTLPLIAAKLRQLESLTGENYLTSNIVGHFCTALVDTSLGTIRALEEFEKYNQMTSGQMVSCWTDKSFYPQIVARKIETASTAKSDNALCAAILLTITKEAFGKTGRSLKKVRDEFPNEIRKLAIAVSTSQAVLTDLLHTSQSVGGIVQWWTTLSHHDPCSPLITSIIAQNLSQFSSSDAMIIRKEMLKQGDADAVLNELYRQIDTHSLRFYLDHEESIRRDLSELYQKHSADLLIRVRLDNITISVKDVERLLSCVERPENQKAQKQILNAVAQKLSSFTSSDAMFVRKEILKRGYLETILNELHRQIDTHSLRFYLDHEESIRRDLSELYQKHSADLLMRIRFDNITVKDAVRLLSCVERPENHKARKSVLDAICTAFPTTRPDPAAVELLKKIDKTYQTIQEQPNGIVPLLLLSQVNFKEKDVGSVCSVFSDNRSIYDSLPKARQDAMRHWLLPLLFEQATEVDIHEKIVRLFATNNYVEAFVNEYMYLAEKILVAWKKGKIDKRFLSLLQYYLECEDDRLIPFLGNGLAKSVFAKFSDNDFDIIEKKLFFLKHLSGTEKNRWESVKKRVRDSNQKPISKIYHFIQKLFGGQ